MGIEIERKFLVMGEPWQTAPEPMRLRQGYLSLAASPTVRIRSNARQAFLTIKGPARDLVRAEFEYEIPLDDAEELLTHCQGVLIEKLRYRIPVGKHVWEVDQFLGENQGLVVAEIELESSGEPFEKPTWVGKEVSDDLRYANSQLALTPFCKWGSINGAG